MKRKLKKKKNDRKIAKERINTLFKKADKAFKREPVLAHKYIHSARKLAMKFKIRIPSELKRRICKHCYRYLVPNINCRIRTNKGSIIYYCLECKKYMRFRYK